MIHYPVAGCQAMINTFNGHDNTLMKLTEIKNKSSKTKSKHYFGNIEQDTLSNTNYRKVMYTTKNMQLVVMALKPKEEIGMETHENGAQFVRVEKGSAKIVIGDSTFNAVKDDAVVIPEGTKHNIVNTGDGELKLYLIYSPPEHEDGAIQKNKS